MPGKAAAGGEGKRRRKRNRHFTKRLKFGERLSFIVNGAFVNAWFDERKRVQVQVIGVNPRLVE